MDVTDHDGAALDPRQGAGATIQGAPTCAASGRGGVSTACSEMTVHIRLQPLKHTAAQMPPGDRSRPRRWREGLTPAHGHTGGRAECSGKVARQEAQLGDATFAAASHLQHPKYASLKIAPEGLAPRDCGADQPDRARPHFNIGPQRYLAVLSP